MKNKIALGLAALVALTNVKVSAGDREWATVGKVLTGVADRKSTRLNSSH